MVNLVRVKMMAFQHTAARRRLQDNDLSCANKSDVSTHSRAEAAAFLHRYCALQNPVSTHSRAEAAAYGSAYQYLSQIHVSTHSRAEAAANGRQSEPLG